MPSVHDLPSVRTFALIAALSLGAAAAEPTPLPRSRQLFQPDMNREFAVGSVHPSRTGREFNTTGARTPSFSFEQKFQPKEYRSSEFRAKNWWGGGFKFSTGEARTKTYETKEAPSRTAPTRDAREAGKTAATRDLPDGRREYLGPEAARTKKPLQPEELPKITNDLRKIESVEDVKELLNKNK